MPLKPPLQEQSEPVKPLITLIHFYLRTAEPSQSQQLQHSPCIVVLGLSMSSSCISLQSEPSP